MCYDSAVSQVSKALLIGYVWPEPKSSAAGRRQLDWVRFFKNRGAEVHVASQARIDLRDLSLDSLNLSLHSISANDSHFDDWVRELNPTHVVFDRFVTEEQFGWRIESVCPSAVRILDTQDLHALRRVRSEWIRAHPKAAHAPTDLTELKFLLEHSEDFLRELASIHRSDLTLLISSFEERLLRDAFRVELADLATLGFAYPKSEQIEGPSFAERKGFSFIGNFRHEPNLDAVQWLSREIWPKIRAERPSAEIDVFGAYTVREATALHDPKNGFYVRGHAPHSIETLSQYRALLAPLRFGAGLKGKITDAWASETPVVTTPIGAEGFIDASQTSVFGGLISHSAEEFVRDAIRIYDEEATFKAKGQSGRELLDRLFAEAEVFARFDQALNSVEASLKVRRQSAWLGRMLRREQMRSTEYFSRWIESKNKLRGVELER